MTRHHNVNFNPVRGCAVHPWLRLVPLAILVILIVSRPGFAETIIFKQNAAVTVPSVGINIPSYDGTQDNYVSGTGTQFGTGVNSNFGGAPSLDVDGSATTGGFGGPTSNFRSFVRFDISALDGKFSTINSATLRLYIENPGSPGDTTSVHRLTAGNSHWREGVNDGSFFSGNPGNTFNRAVQSPSFPWAGSAGADTPGVDYLATPLASTANGGAPNSAVDFALTGDGQGGSVADLIGAWASATTVNGLGQSPWTDLVTASANEGFRIRGNGGLQTFHSSEGTSGLEPELIINFTPIPEPSTFALATIALLMSCVARRRWLRPCRR